MMTIALIRTMLYAGILILSLIGTLVIGMGSVAQK